MHAPGAAQPAAEHQRLSDSPIAQLPYRRLRRLGGGAFTEVLLACGDDPDDLVVVKLARPDFAGDPGVLAMLGREAKLLAALQGAGVVRLLDAADGLLVLEYLAYGSLLPLLGRPVAAWRLPLAGLAVALDAIHGQGIVHRDIRPENAMFKSPTELVWIDLQSAAPMGSPAAVIGPGTVPYASPEQRGGKPPDPCDDVYSFGVLIHQLVTGQLPQASSDLAASMGNREDLPPRLVEWLAAALGECRSDRPSDMGDIARILRVE